MALRWGLGPVFAYEWLMTSRRWQLYALRSLFVLAILIVLWCVWQAQHNTDYNYRPTIRDQARYGQEFFYAIITTQLALVLLAAPAATAGAICLDKARGTLVHLLVTDLSSAEIVLGKLASRLVPVLGLVGCTLPVLSLNVLLGGVDPHALIAAFLVTLAVAVLGCTLALTLSVWGNKTHEVLLLNYVFWGAALLAYPAVAAVVWEMARTTPPDWVARTNPFWLVYSPFERPGTTNLVDAMIYLAVCLALSAGLVVVAVARVRAVAIRQTGKPARKRLRLREDLSLIQQLWSSFGPSLDSNPVLWREWHRRRPSSWVSLVWVLYALGAVLFSGLTVAFDKPGRHDEMGIFVVGLQVAFGLLLLSVTASTSLLEERVRGSLDVLLTTPLTTQSILWGKWQAAYRGVVVLAILPGLTALAMACGRGHNILHALLIVPLTLAYGAALTSLGLALATWFSRIGWAVATSVTVYVLVTVGWSVLVMALLRRGPGAEGPGLISASPFFGPAFLVVCIVEPRDPELSALFFWDIFWIIAYSAVGLFLLWLTMKTFDSYLGRIVSHRRAAQQPRQAILRSPAPLWVEQDPEPLPEEKS